MQAAEMRMTRMMCRKTLHGGISNGLLRNRTRVDNGVARRQVEARASGRRPWERFNTFFQPFKKVFFSRNLTIMYLKMRIFWKNLLLSPHVGCLASKPPPHWSPAAGLGACPLNSELLLPPTVAALCRLRFK